MASELVSISDSVVEVRLQKTKSAGLAWLLSMIVPGLGHFYCGTRLRGGLVLGFSIAGVWAFWQAAVAQAASPANASAATAGLAVTLVPLLYVFGFVDAYFTAREINRGIDPSLVDNPRVACLLNFLTKGFGYFYLGQRVKGAVVFVLFTFAPLAQVGGVRVAAVLSMVAVLAQIGIAIDAHRLGRESFKSQVATMTLREDVRPSRVPAVVPVLIGGAIVAAVAGVLLLGVVVQVLAGESP